MERNRGVFGELVVVSLVLGVVGLGCKGGEGRPGKQVVTNETAARGTLASLVQAQREYRQYASDKCYAESLETLSSGAGAGDVPYVSSTLATGVHDGYAFVLRRTGCDGFLVMAGPEQYRETGVRSFVVDESGVVRCADKHGESAGLGDPECAGEAATSRSS